ncbi:AAA domain-containing protein [Nocardia neocaledoniensis]|uniref:AAA domain-containing protein n=1 Tax=Nocardia neocaledoniensis TaxID=236511 RepID=UPI00245409B5|nr:AAA domain-containing protein [Nocardia neocaledoniensis]
MTTEMFNPQKVDKVDHERLVFAVEHGRPLPWEPAHELADRRLKPHQAWQHIVYLGVYQLDKATDLLATVFEPDPDSFDERPTGDSAIAAFAVAEDGRAVDDSEVLSSCAWAVAKVLRAGPDHDWVADFQDSSMDFSREWRDFVTAAEPSSPPETEAPQPTRRVLDVDGLLTCLSSAVATTGIGSELPHTEIRIHSKIVSRRTAGRAAETDFLNSFIMGDLRLVAEQTAKANIGTALADYLRPDAEIHTGARTDVRKELGTVLALAAPDRVPGGRWLSDPEHALALNQQLAVNAALGIPGAGVVGVNGPPGTGKTTMLRDLVAEIVTDRARRLAALSAPMDAFTQPETRWKTGQYTRVVRAWRPQLTGFEIVVASANNGAVENVTDEIPAADAIADAWRDHATEADYFADIASALLMPKDAPPPPLTDPQAGWALVAARLGNKENRSRFADMFWYHKPDEADAANDWRGLLHRLKEFEQSGPERPWSEETAEFGAALARVEALRDARLTAYRDIDRKARLTAESIESANACTAAVRRIETAREQRATAIQTISRHEIEAERLARIGHAEQERAARARRDTAERTLADHQAEVHRIKEGRWATAERAVRSWEAELGRRWQTRAEHQARRPGQWQRLRTLGAAGRSWERQDSWLAAEISQAGEELEAAQARLGEIQAEVDRATHAVEITSAELAAAQRFLEGGAPRTRITYEPLITAQRHLAAVEEELAAALRAEARHASARETCERELEATVRQLDESAASLGKNFPDSTWWQERERREHTALWTDPEWNRARSELFLAALTLHRTFLQHTASTMRRNLQAAVDLLSGAAPRTIPQEAAQAAWQSLFLVVPVVSTTFASYGRLFSHLGREALGWLLIDEAGQATPQSAVGALWRTQRAVVVGDPLQLEPITSLPYSAEQGIRNELGVDEQWSPSRTSVQRLADRLTALGTELPDVDGTTWVGVPLSVQRSPDWTST